MGSSRLLRATVAVTFTFAACIGDDPASTSTHDDGGASSPDGGAASGDGGTGAETSAPSYCATNNTHAFCADFDAVDNVAAGWDDGKATLSARATASFGVVAKPPSPPSVAQLAIPQTPAGTPQFSTFALLDKTVPRNDKTTATATFQAVLPSTAPANASDTIRYFGLFVGDVGVALYRYGTGVGWYMLVSGVSSTPYFFDNLPPVDRWTSVNLAVVFHPTAGAITLTFDNVQALGVADIATLPSPDAGPPASTVRLNLGPRQELGPIPAVSTMFDDVTLDVK